MNKILIKTFWIVLICVQAIVMMVLFDHKKPATAQQCVPQYNVACPAGFNLIPNAARSNGIIYPVVFTCTNGSLVSVNYLTPSCGDGYCDAGEASPSIDDGRNGSVPNPRYCPADCNTGTGFEHSG